MAKPNSTKVTIERVENGLDTLAEIIVLYGDKGRKLLPLYEQLEKELNEIKAENHLLSSVFARAKRSSGQTVAQS
jgi:hypothetical protein